MEAMARTLRQALLGKPLHTREADEQRLSNPVALAIFASDPLSSVAYATEEIMLMLLLAGSLALKLALPIAVSIGVLLVIVIISYRQTIRAYPGGGGAYIVAKENLGTIPGLVAGGSLLVDYVLTVAVSTAAGTAAVTSAFPALRAYRVEIAILLVAVLALANLRGVKESGTLFAGPTFAFIGVLALLVVVGLLKYLTGGSLDVTRTAVPAVQDLTLFLVLKAFSSGCAAMTGVEAIANGVEAFRKPAAENALRTLTWMGGILLFLFLGITALAHVAEITPIEGGETIVSQIGRGVFGSGIMYYVLQATTAVILVLAANTSYAGFPRLGSFIASDGFLPSLLQDRGYRLVHSKGIFLLTAAAMVLLVLFAADTHRLIPLYTVGVFASFTLSQSGMVIRWWKRRGARWKPNMAVNIAGAVTTGVVTLVVAVTKFALGAWIVLVLVPVLVAYFLWVHRQYATVTEHMRMPLDARAKLDCRSEKQLHNHVVVLVGSVDRRIVRSIQYARSIGAESIEAVFIDATGDKAEDVRRAWDELDCGLPLTVIESPFREIVEPIRTYIHSIQGPDDDHVTTVVIPQFVSEERADYGGVYVYRAGLRFWIKRALFSERNVIVVDVPYHLKPGSPESDTPESAPD